MSVIEMRDLLDGPMNSPLRERSSVAIDGLRDANATGAHSSILPAINDYNSQSAMAHTQMKGNASVMNQSASGLTMILGGGLDPRVNQSVATSIHRAEASLTVN